MARLVGARELAVSFPRSEQGSTRFRPYEMFCSRGAVPLEQPRMLRVGYARMMPVVWIMDKARDGYFCSFLDGVALVSETGERLIS